MYYYIIESAKKAEFEKIELKVKEILTNFDILGEFKYIDNLLDVEDAVKAGISKGFSTIVAIGGDILANKIAINLISSKIALGILPLEEGVLSSSLGLGNWKSACEILAARRVLLMDAGIINDKYFISEILASHSPDFPPVTKSKSIFSQILGNNDKTTSSENIPIDVEIEENYQIHAEISGLIISNIRPFGSNLDSVRQSMIDSQLHLAFSDRVNSAEVYNSLNNSPKFLEKNNLSIFHANQLEVRSDKPLFFFSGQEVIARTPATVQIIPQSLKIIGGRLR